MTCVGMVVTGVTVYLLRGYGEDKTGVILLASAYKLVEVVEGLDHGEFPRMGRLYVAGRVGTLRIILNDILFFPTLVASRDLAAALAVALTATIRV